LLAGVVDERAVARLHGAQVLEGGRIAHAVPHRAALARQVLPGVGPGLGLQKPHAGILERSRQDTAGGSRRNFAGRSRRNTAGRRLAPSTRGPSASSTRCPSASSTCCPSASSTLCPSASSTRRP